MTHNKIFISYAKEDFTYAEKLYEYLLSQSYDPWLDKKKLHIGQQWEFFIKEALHKTDFIILLLSNISVNKRGYVQKEFRKALEYCESKLDSDIYVIPIKIDDCEVPMSLQKFQWIEFHDNVFEQIKTAVELQRKVFAKESNTLELKEGSIQIIDNVKEGELGEISPKHIYEFHFPQIQLLNNESLDELNTIIKYDIFNYMVSVRNNYYEHLLTFGSENALDPDNPEDSTSYGNIEIKVITPFFVSLTSFISEYYTGTAHGMFGTKGMNYLNNPLRFFELKELFSDQNNYLQKIRDLVHEKLMIIAENEEDYYSEGDELNDGISEANLEEKRNSFYVLEEGLLPKEENFENYFFKKDALVFIFNPYHITAWSQGDHFPEITFEELLKTFPKELKLHHFISNMLK